MKTAISIPDNLFAIANQEAKRLGISRSELISTAVRFYLDNKKDSFITEQLDKIYGASSEGLDDMLKKMQTDSLSMEEW